MALAHASHMVAYNENLVFEPTVLRDNSGVSVRRALGKTILTSCANAACLCGDLIKFYNITVSGVLFTGEASSLCY